MDRKYEILYNKLKEILKCVRADFVKSTNKPYYYIFNDDVLIKLVEKLPTDQFLLGKCGIYGSKYYYYGDKIINAIENFIKFHNIDVNKWRNEKIFMKESDLINNELDEFSDGLKNNISLFFEGMEAKFLENNQFIDVKICDLHDEKGTKFCSLKYKDSDGYLLKQGTNDPRIWSLNKLVNSGNLLVDKEFIEKQERLIKEKNEKINTYKNFLKEFVIFNDKELSYNEEQLDAIVSNKNTLVTARAGSGKTRVIIGKMIYLMEMEGLKKENIMAFCFNREAKEEINKRIRLQCLINNESKYFNYNEFAKTFHSLAYDIVKPTREENILEHKSAFLKKIINKIKNENPKFREVVYRFFKDSSSYIDKKYFSNASDYYFYLKNSCYKTLNGEQVKSRSEKIIADFLFEHGINYIYEKTFFPSKIEKKWPILIGKDEYKKFSQLVDDKQETKPDFYLSDYNLIWEHWAITGLENEKEKLEFERSIGNYNEYLKNKSWKQKFWNSKFLPKLASGKYNNPFKFVKGLIETDDKIFNSKSRDDVEIYIETILRKYGVECKKIPDEVLLNKVWNNAIDAFTLLIEQFINKLQQYYFDNIDLFLKKIDETENPKAKELYKIGYQVYVEYLNVLHSQNKDKDFLKFGLVKMDYNELMYKSIIDVEKGKYDHVIKNLKWILIDEYQDFSRLFDTLLNAIINRNNEIKVFAVGDDWQAINRFAGSNIKYFNEFQFMHDNSELLGVSNNYRSCSNLVNIANKFMLSNNYSGMPSKPISTEIGKCILIDTEKVFVDYENGFYSYFLNLNNKNDIWRYERAKHIERCFNIIINNEDKNIMILNRSNMLLGMDLSDMNKTLKRMVLEYKPKYNYDSLVKVSTVHASKGEEADIVIILDVNEKSFPVHNPNNDLFEIFDQSALDSINDEEKLFYVALTRARKEIYITYNHRYPSKFISDLGFENVVLYK